MLHLFLVLAVLSLASALPSSTPSNLTLAIDCMNPPPDNCDFYGSCLEAKVHCGPEGYPIGYGQKYCQKFQAERSTLSPKGQQWMLDTLHCLQLALVEDATAAIDEDEETCSALSKKAFGTHAKCYLASGLCKLGPADWFAIVDIVELQTLFESWDAFKASVDAAVGCAGFYAFVLANWWWWT